MWLSRLDAKAQAWPAPAKWAYLCGKWLLIVLGAYLVIGTMLMRMGVIRQ
jgi:hypothetical protein